MQMNGSHLAWFRLLSKAAPRLEVDVKVPFNVHEVQAQVTLPAQSGETATAYDTKTVTMNYEDDRIAQGFKQLEVSQITLADYLKQFPTGASPASGFVIVRRTPAETQHAALDRRSFLLGKFRTPPTMVSTVLLLALVSALKCFAAAGAVSGESTLLVQIVALAIGYGLLTLSWSLATTIRSAVKERRGRLERNLEYVRSKPPSPRAFQEATALPPNSKGVSNISDRWNSVQGPLTLAEFDLFSKSDGDLNRLTPGEVTVEWQPGWAGIKAWFQDDRLTVFQRCLNWIPAVLDVKTTFRIYPHRLIYTTYKAFNVSLWQCWVLYNKYKHNKSAWKADNKKLHYLSLLGIFLVAAAGLYLFRPKTLVEIGFIIKMAQPYSPWLAQHTSPLFLSIFLFFLIGLLGRGIFLFYGEGGPIYWWALKFAGFFLASRFPASMEDDFFAKTNQKISHVVDFVDGDVLGRTMNGQINGNIKSFESNLNRIGAELSVGLTRRLRDRSLDSQINLADSFFEYDRKVASGEIRSSLSSIGLDLAKHDPILSKNWSKISQKDMARARLDLVIDRLEKGNHPRGLLFALVATDNLELALDGLDHERTVALRPTLQALPGRTASLVPGLFDVYSESVREHQQFKDINKDIRLLNGAPQDRNKLRTKFISLYNGESKMQGMLDLVFDPRDIKVPLVNTNTFMFLDQRRWQKTDPDKMRDDLDSLPDPGATEGTVRNTDYFEDVFLRGSNGDAMVTGARLLMAERHGGGLLEGLAYFGIPLVPDSHKRGVYVGQEMLTNPRSAVRTLDLLRRVMRAKVVVISATQIMDNFILLLKMRIPKRLQFLASRQIVPLYSSQFDPKRIADAPVGQEPIVVFGAEPSSTQKYFPWKNAIRVIPAAPHLFVLVFLLAIVRREPAWLNAAFDHIEKDPRLTLEERQKLTWLRRNLLGEDGLAIGHYLEDVIGTAWAEQDEIPVQRFANIPDLPARNADGGWDQAEKKQIEDALRNIGRWDTNEIIAPSHWPLQSHKDVDHREREAA